jgi:predicted DNA-binding transcriptional regulator AlpA
MTEDRSAINCLSAAKVMEKLSRKKSWFWQQVRTNPQFPQPVRLPGTSRPVWLESDIDEFVMKGINK